MSDTQQDPRGISPPGDTVNAPELTPVRVRVTGRATVPQDDPVSALTYDENVRFTGFCLANAKLALEHEDFARVDMLLRLIDKLQRDRPAQEEPKGRYGNVAAFFAKQRERNHAAIIAYANRTPVRPCRKVGRRRAANRPAVHATTRGRERKSPSCRTGSASTSARRSDSAPPAEPEPPRAASPSTCPVCGSRLIRGCCPNGNCTWWS